MQHCLAWLSENEGITRISSSGCGQLPPFASYIVWMKPIQDAADHPEADSIRGVIPAAQNPFKMWTVEIQFGRIADPLLKVEGIKEPYIAPSAGFARCVLADGSYRRDLDEDDPGETIDDRGCDLSPDDRHRGTRLILMSPPIGRALSDYWSDDRLDIVTPRPQARRTLPEKISLIVLDFDGVLTDDRVWVNARGGGWSRRAGRMGWGWSGCGTRRILR